MTSKRIASPCLMKIYIVVMDVVRDVTYSHNRRPLWPSGYSAALATTETCQVLLAGVPGLFFSGFSGFRPTGLARLI